jgi:hypothetical protein
MTHTVESQPELPAERSAEFLAWWHEHGRKICITPECAEYVFEAGRSSAEAIQPKVGPSRKDIQTAVLRGLSAWGESIGGHTLDFVVDEVMRLYAAPPQPKEPS